MTNREGNSDPTTSLPRNFISRQKNSGGASTDGLTMSRKDLGTPRVIIIMSITNCAVVVWCCASAAVL